jgi:hypothetical protein
MLMEMHANRLLALGFIRATNNMSAVFVLAHPGTIGPHRTRGREIFYFKDYASRDLVGLAIGHRHLLGRFRALALHVDAVRILSHHVSIVFLFSKVVNSHAGALGTRRSLPAGRRAVHVRVRPLLRVRQAQARNLSGEPASAGPG